MTGLATNYLTSLAESGLLPDSVIRSGIRRLVGQRQSQIQRLSSADVDAFIESMNESEIAPVPESANEQHYEVSAEFFREVLGVHLKYSCCDWTDGAEDLDEAEAAALEMTCQRAQISDGMRVLDLGCGWGSLSLWIAQCFSESSVTAVSNSSSQKRFIDAEANALGLSNLRVITADMNDFSIDEKFDRVVSVEMFEHMRNYRKLFGKVSQWLKDDGLFFMHIFCHRGVPYEFKDTGPADWMSRHFFTGGIMPSANLPLQFQDHLTIDDQWFWDGLQYQKTAEAWLRNMDSNKDVIMPALETVYGTRNAHRWWARWRIFFLAVSEMFGSNHGQEWKVGHYLFRQKAVSGQKEL